MQTPFELNRYVDFSRVIADEAYAFEKHLTVKKQKAVENSESNNLFLIQYIKNNLNHSNITNLGRFRSVITDGIRVISFAPPKSIAIDTLKQMCMTPEDIKITEFCEGTMINLFYNNMREDWEIATRGNIGARCKFYQYSPKTFRTMFLEAMNELNIEFTSFDKTKSYSFVLQHPDNRIVVPFKEKQLILTNIYSFDQFTVYAMDDTFVQKEAERLNCRCPKAIHEIIPESEYSFDAITNYFNSMNEDYRTVGAMFVDTTTGFRAKVRNPTYEYVRQLKGNSPKIQYQYYCLRTLGKVRDFLYYYPEMRKKFSEMRQDLHKWTNALFNNYTQCYIKKSAPLKTFPFPFRPHMYQLHQLYLNQLRAQGGYVSRSVVIDYINNLEAPRLMFAINYFQKQNRVECATAPIAQIISQEI